MRAAIESEAAPRGESENVDLDAIARRTVIPASEVTADSADLMASLPWWVSRGLLYVVGGFVFCALVWAIFARVDDVAAARGAIIPEGQVRPAQALEAGTAISVNVREGDKVAKGQTLVQLDDTVLRAREKQARLEYEGAQVNLISLRNSGADILAINGAESQITALKNNLDAIELSITRSRLVAPISGTVTYLAFHGAGTVVQEGDVVANIAPDGARLVAEVRIPNEHIAKVRVGLPAKLFIDAYPYQQYGVFDATVLSVSPDAIIAPNGESYYRAVVVPTKTRLDTGVDLSPGLALEARIITDHRSVIQLFLDPFKKTRADDPDGKTVATVESERTS
jgi:multidrug efflux pump subunit AcrA (membrane-fusion protein)